MSTNATDQPRADVSAESVAWPAFFEEYDLHGCGVGTVVMWLDACGPAESETAAKALVSDALDAGELVTDASGYYPAEAVADDSASGPPERNEQPAAESESERHRCGASGPSQGATEASSDLVQTIESLEPADLDRETLVELLGECATVIDKQSEDLAQQAERIGALESELDSMTALTDAVNLRAKQNNHALFQLQVRELQAGATLPTEQLNVDALRHDLDLDIEFVGDSKEYLRLADSETAGDQKNRSAEMPDADELCQAEQWRQLYRRSFITKADLQTGEFRAMCLWDDLAKLATDGGTSHFVSSATAKVALVDSGAGPLAGMTPDSQNTATNRTMKALATEYAESVVELVKSDGSLRLRFDLDELKAAQKPLYQSSGLEAGDVLVGT